MLKKYLALAGSLMGWFAVIAQCWLMMENRQVAGLETLVRFFSYFTILTNTWVALAFLVLYCQYPRRWYRNIEQSHMLTALVVFISMVGIVYQLVLREIWSPQGLQMWVDELLHTLIPLFFVVYWWVFAPHPTMKWMEFLPWLLYPLFYFIFVLIRGYYSGFYPYPFLDLTQISMGDLVVNSIILLTCFTLLAGVFILIDRYWRRHRKLWMKSG